MSTHRNSLTAQNTSTKICHVHKPRYADFYFISILASGDFGGGTVTLQGSVDGGTTKIPLKDALGNAATLAAAGNVNLTLGVPNTNTVHFDIYASIGTATTPSISITAFDNLG